MKKTTLPAILICLFFFAFSCSKENIPATLEECFVKLDKILDSESIKKITSMKEDEIFNLHFSLGMWIRNNWGLWEGSELSKWFNSLGIYHPDDMSGIILQSYWRYKHNQPVKLEEQIQIYKNYWKKRNEMKEEENIQNEG